MNKELIILGIASGIGAEKRGAEMGVWDLYYSFPQKNNLYFSKVIYTDNPLRKLQAINEWLKISIETNNFIETNITKKNIALFITGDHSSGFSVWNGMLNKYKGSMGLIWIDAHLDAHTMKSSESKNIHGMPISHLLGYGDTKVKDCNIYPLDPKNLCFIGTRNYEKSELNFLNTLGVKIIFMKNITKKNISNHIHDAIEYVSKNVQSFGISIDLDGFDPTETPGTGCFCPNGLWVEEVSESLKKISNNKKFCGLEITEFDPSIDNNQKTKNNIFKIIEKVF